MKANPYLPVPSIIRSKMPVADELQQIRRKSVKLFKILGFKAVAASVKAGGPLESNIRFVRSNVHGRKIANPITHAQHRYNATVEAIKKRLKILEEHVKKVGG